jgi:hypothetical protein
VRVSYGSPRPGMARPDGPDSTIRRSRDQHVRRTCRARTAPSGTGRPCACLDVRQGGPPGPFRLLAPTGQASCLRGAAPNRARAVAGPRPLTPAPPRSASYRLSAAPAHPRRRGSTSQAWTNVMTLVPPAPNRPHFSLSATLIHAAGRRTLDSVATTGPPQESRPSATQTPSPHRSSGSAGASESSGVSRS